jgi:hypothetical protein
MKPCYSSLLKINDKIKALWLLAPLLGIFLFVFLYFIATLFYPGGSQTDEKSKAFSWVNNYWCNLLNETAINGEHNTARPIAIGAMFILGLALAVFWYTFPQQIEFRKRIRLTIQISGAVSMIIGIFIFTNLHDTIINAAGLCALVALSGTFAGLYKIRWIKLFWFGIFNLALIVLNNILYYGAGLKLYLPVVQKITFLSFLLWICLIDINLFRKANIKSFEVEEDKLLKKR